MCSHLHDVRERVQVENEAQLLRRFEHRGLKARAVAVEEEEVTV